MELVLLCHIYVTAVSHEISGHSGMMLAEIQTVVTHWTSANLTKKN